MIVTNYRKETLKMAYFNFFSLDKDGQLDRQKEWPILNVFLSAGCFEMPSYQSSTEQKRVKHKDRI